MAANALFKHLYSSKDLKEKEKDIDEIITMELDSLSIKALSFVT